MSNSQNYYAFTLSANGTSTSAYYSVTPTSNLQISQGGATIYPTEQSMTTVSIYPETLQIQAPSGILSAGVTIITDADVVSGRLLVSPVVNVPVAVTLYGSGGQQLGQFILDSGEGSGLFSFPTDSKSAMSAGDALNVVKQQIAGK